VASAHVHSQCHDNVCAYYKKFTAANNLSIACVNAKSVGNKAVTISQSIIDNHIGIFVITETRHEKSDSMTLKRIIPSGYRWIDTARPIPQDTANTCDGGLAFVYSDSIRCRKKDFNIIVHLLPKKSRLNASDLKNFRLCRTCRSSLSYWKGLSNVNSRLFSTTMTSCQWYSPRTMVSIARRLQSQRSTMTCCSRRWWADVCPLSTWSDSCFWHCGHTLLLDQLEHQFGLHDSILAWFWSICRTELFGSCTVVIHRV